MPRPTNPLSVLALFVYTPALVAAWGVALAAGLGRVLERFAGREEESHFAVVTHGLVLRSLFERRLLGEAGLAEHANADGQVAIANTAVSFIEPQGTAPGALDFRVDPLACIAHLDEDTAPRANPNVGM